MDMHSKIHELDAAKEAADARFAAMGESLERLEAAMDRLGRLVGADFVEAEEEA